MSRSVLLFSQSQSAQDLIASSGVAVPAAVKDALRSGYSACDGSALYRYDLNTERMQITGVQLNQPDPPDVEDKTPQACFDRLVISYGKTARVRLSLEQMKRFGQQFLASCR